MTFEELRREYEAELVGEGLYARITNLADRLLRRRDPRVYAQGAADYRDTLGDVVNEFLLQVLIGERQIDYVMLTAGDLGEFDRLLQYHLRRFLARTRTRTVVDNLIDRSVLVLRDLPFSVVAGSGASERYGLSTRSYAQATGSDDREIRRAATLAKVVPKVPSEAVEREPKVYDAEGLAGVLRLLVDRSAAPVGRAELQVFFGYLLTGWTTSILGLSEEDQPVEASLSPEQEVVVSDTARTLVQTFAYEDRVIFQYKFANLPDRELAAELGLSRQSAAPRKAALFARLRDELSGFDDKLQAAVLNRIALEIATAGRDLS